MMKSRTKKSLRNSFLGLTSNLVITILNFITRTLFIKILGTEYLGISGLFTNILYVLSFAELGISHAITFSMYKPAANNDQEKLKSLLKLYKKYYVGVGIFIFAVGLLIIPFLPYIIKDVPHIKENLIVIYILYLCEVSFSYFFSYKRSMLVVYQNDYICDIAKIIVYTLKAILQVIVLLFTKNYIIYLIIFALASIVTNITISIIVSKRYKFINDKNVVALEKQEVTAISTKIKSLLLYKIGRVSLSGTDNIIISSLLGLSFVGLYSNYSLIITAVSGGAYIILKGAISSVGNVNATEKTDKKEDLMKLLLFVSSWIYGLIAICLLVLLNPFITIWIGKNYLLSIKVVMTLALYVLVDGMEFSTHAYISTLGLFNESKYYTLCSAIINIVLSLILGHYFGLFGIFIATSIAKITTTTLFEPYVVYKYELKRSPRNYYRKYLKYFVVVLFAALINYEVLSLINGTTILMFIAKAIIAFLLSNGLFILCLHNEKEFSELITKLKMLVRRKRA